MVASFVLLNEKILHNNATLQDPTPKDVFFLAGKSSVKMTLIYSLSAARSVGVYPVYGLVLDLYMMNNEDGKSMRTMDIYEL